MRRQAVTAAVLLLLPTAIGAVWLRSQARRARTEEVRQEAISAVSASAASFDQFLRGLDSVASALALNPSVIALNRAECDRLFAEVLRQQSSILNILLSAPDETIKGSALPTTNVKPRLSMPHVQQVIATGGAAVSELSVGPLTHKPTIILGYPVRSNLGAVVGVLAMGLDLSQLQSTFTAPALADGSIVTLTNPQGLVLARSREADRYIGTTIEVPAPSGSGAPGFAQQTDMDGVERFVASTAIGRGPWLLSVGIPTSVIASRMWPLGWRALAVIAIAALAGVVLILLMSSRLSRQLTGLREVAQHSVRSDLSSMPTGRPLNNELAQLQDAFLAMADSLRRTRAELEGQVDQEGKVREMLETLQRHIVRQERLAAVGLLLSGVAHELNNPLQAIMGAAELLERRADLSADSREDVVLISTQTQRAAEIIRNLSRFGTPRAALPAAIDLRDVVSEVVQLRRTDLEAAGISCEVQATSAGKVFASFTELEQVVLNFVINAQQSIKAAGVENGLIVIRSSDADASVRLEVIDNGPGVPSEDESKLFQPFFTTKPVGEGTGLGLSVSHGIIESYGGTVGYRRNDAGGATFFFDLPRV